MTVALDLSTPERLRDLLGEEVPRARVMSTIKGCSASIERYLNRTLLYEEEFTETLSVDRPHQRTFQLSHDPIDELTSVNNVDPYGSSTEVTPDFYTVNGSLLQIADGWGDLYTGHAALVVVGAGGMAATFEEFLELYPDIVMETEAWMLHRVRRMTQPGVTSQSAGGSSQTYAPLDMPQALLSALDQFRHGSFVV